MGYNKQQYDKLLYVKNIIDEYGNDGVLTMPFNNKRFEYQYRDSQDSFSITYSAKSLQLISKAYPDNTLVYDIIINLGPRHNDEIYYAARFSTEFTPDYDNKCLSDSLLQFFINIMSIRI